MMFSRSATPVFRIVLTALLSLWSLSAFAANSITLPNMAALISGDWSSYDSAIVTTYLNNNDEGGGVWKRSGTSCTVDGGVVVKDGKPGTPNCWIRQFVGPVDLRWYGPTAVPDATSSLCLPSGGGSRTACDASVAFAAAQVAAYQYGNGTVTTGGRSIVIAYSANVTLVGLDKVSSPANYFGVTLDCEAPATGASKQSGGDPTATPYYLQNSALIINPAYSLVVGQSANVKNCRVFPSWYVSRPSSLRDVITMSQQFTGTPLRFGASDVTTEAASADNLFILGFDTCTDMRATSRATYTNILTGCNNQSYLHNQRGSVYLDHWSSKNYLFLRASGGGRRFDVAKYPITNLANSGGEIAVTVSTADRPMEVIAGDKVFVTDVGEATSIKTTGAMVTGQFTITNIPTSDGIQINPGFLVTDLGTGACFAANTSVSSVAYDSGTDTYTATVNNANLCTTSTDELIIFRGTNYGPAGANYLWVVRSVTNVDPTHETLVMRNSSWTGPTLTYDGVHSETGADWNANTSAINIFDATNIIVGPGGQGPYFCALGTPPFCTPPTGFTFSTTTLSSATPVDASNTYTTVTVGSTANWPCYGKPSQCVGVVRMVNGTGPANTEYMAYTWIDPTHIALTVRGWDGTTPAAHDSSSYTVTLTSAAPMVVGVVQATKDIYATALLNATAQSNQTNQTVSFLNDPNVSAGGMLIINPSYRDTTQNVAAGPPIDGLVNVTGTGSSGTTALTISGDYWKVFRGMNVRDITTPSRIPAGTVVANDPTSTAITLSNNLASSIPVGGDVIQFYGCGMPSQTLFYQGNCVATSHLVGGGAPEDLTSQGVNLTNIHTFGTRVAVHLLDAKGTAYAQLGLANGGGSGAQQDVASVGFWADGDTDTWRWVGGWATAYNTIVNTPSGGSNHGGTMTNVVLATKGGMLIQNVGGTAQLQTANITTATPGSIYQDHTANTFALNDAIMPFIYIYTDRVTALQTVICSGSLFANNDICTQAAASHGNGAVGVASMADFVGRPFSKVQYVTLAGYYGPGTGGGGDFTAITSLPTGATVDNGIFVADSVGNLFQRNNDTGDVRQWGAYCDVQRFSSIGTSTASSATITTGTYQAPALIAGTTLYAVLSESGGTTWYPQDNVAVTTRGTGYTYNDTITLAAGGGGTQAILTVTALDTTVGGGAICNASSTACTTASGKAVDHTAGVIFTSVANYGGYTTSLPANPVAQAATSGGGSGATFTLKWVGGPLVTTVSSVGTNALTLAAPATVTQNTIPAWHIGHDDHLAIAAASAYESSFGQQSVYFPSFCGTTVQLELPANTTATFPQTMNPRWVGPGIGQGGIVPLAAMANVLHRSTAGSRNGGLANLTVDARGLATDYGVWLEGGRDFTINQVNILNVTGSGNAGYRNDNASNTVYTGGRVWTETIFSGVFLPDYGVYESGESPVWNQVSVIGATQAFVTAPNGGARFDQMHLFPGGSGPVALYGFRSGGSNIFTNAQIDQATTANIYITGNDGSYLGNTIKCGNDAATRATYGIELTTGATRVAAIVGNTYDQTCDWPSATRIKLDGVINGGSAIMGNAGASIVQFPQAQGLVAQGRLTTSSTLPVITADNASANTIYYLPYTGQGLPVFTNLDAVSTGEGQVLSYYNLTSSGLSLQLDNNAGHTNYQVAGSVYDIFAYNSNTATTKLCTFAWTSTTARNVALVREANSGLWVNTSTLTDCRFGNGSGNIDTIGTNAGVYLGSAYMVADGRTIMTFNPSAAAGGGNARLGLYNAYNRVPWNAQSQDSSAQWTYGTATWRSANNNAANRVTWLDGLSDVFVRGVLVEYVKNSAATGCMVGINLDSTSATPTVIAANDNAGGTTVTATLNTVPTLGLHYHQAMESPLNAANCLFSNGSGYMTLNWGSSY